MWVSRRTDYATRAILALSLEGGGPLKLEELARRTAVPQSVLEQVMPTMQPQDSFAPSAGPWVATGSTSNPKRSHLSASSVCSRARSRRSAARQDTPRNHAR